MSLRNEEDFDNYDDFIYHMAGGDAEQASGGEASSDSEAGSSQSAPLPSPPVERDSENAKDISPFFHPPSSPSYGSSGEEMDTGAFGPAYPSSSDEDSSGLSDAPSDHGELANGDVEMENAESSPYEAYVAQEIPHPDPAPATPPAEVAEITMRDADPAPGPHQEIVDLVPQENTLDPAFPKQEEVKEMRTSPSPPSPPQAAPITRATPASPPSTPVQEAQSPTVEPKPIEQHHALAPVANEAIPSPTPYPPPSAEIAPIQTLLSSLALLNEKSKAFFAQLHVLHAKIDAL